MHVYRARVEPPQAMTRTTAVFASVLMVAGALKSGARPPEALRVSVTPALSPCASRLVDAFTASGYPAVLLEVIDAPGITEADVLIADDSELTRLLEGGLVDERTAVDLGEVPWVMLTPTGDPAPPTLSSFGASTRAPIAILGGMAGRAARAALGLAPGRLLVSREPAHLREAEHALLPRTLAGRGRQVLAEGVAPLTAVAARVAGSPRDAEAEALLRFLRGGEARRIFEAAGGVPRVVRAGTASGDDTVYARAIVDWWLPGCSLAHNAHNDPGQVLGPPDAANIGGKDLYRGMISLGQGGWVVVDMGQTFGDVPGPEVRVYQTTTSEPITLYAATAFAGPFHLIATRRRCGVRSAGVFSNHCDFDLAEAGITSARYLRVEDGELYPCLAGSTASEGADLDAVQLLSPP